MAPKFEDPPALFGGQSSYDAWKLNPPPESPLYCEGCGGEAGELDYPWGHGWYHLHCLPIGEVVEAIEWNKQSDQLAQAVSICQALVDDGKAKLKSRAAALEALYQKDQAEGRCLTCHGEKRVLISKAPHSILEDCGACNGTGVRS